MEQIQKHRHGLNSRWWVAGGVLHTQAGRLLQLLVAPSLQLALGRVAAIRQLTLGPWGPVLMLQLVAPGLTVTLWLVRRQDAAELAALWRQIAAQDK